ncbi:MAG: ABC transporter permease [Acidobacteriaceae bacterium]
MNRLWAIAFKDIRTRFTDRTLLLIMLVAPLAISSIIGLAFGGLGRSTSPIQHIPVAVVNNDHGGPNGTSFGSIFADLLIEGQLPAATSSSLADCQQTAGQPGGNSAQGDVSLAELIDGKSFDQSAVEQMVADKAIDPPTAPLASPDYLATAARSAVDKGIYTAAVIIPADFSSALASLADARQSPLTASVTVYGNAGQSLSAGIVRSVVDSISAQLASGNIAIGATLAELSKQPSSLANLPGQDLEKLFVCAFMPGTDMVQLSNQPVQAVKTNMAGSLLVTFGSAQALFFAIFTGQMGILSMYEERKNWTLQRILVSPTPRWTILGGKLVGVFVSVLFQLLALVAALTIVGSLIERQLVFIWGTDVAGLGLVLLAVSVVVSGFGMLLAGVLKSIEQANIVGSVLNIALGVLGGAFGFQLPRSVAQFSFVYWARDAFEMLAAGRGDISLNLLVMFVEGSLMFAIGLILFTRKFEV